MGTYDLGVYCSLATQINELPVYQKYPECLNSIRVILSPSMFHVPSISVQGRKDLTYKVTVHTLYVNLLTKMSTTEKRGMLSSLFPGDNIYHGSVPSGMDRKLQQVPTSF